MKKTPLYEDRKAAVIQWNAAQALINSLEQRLSLTQKALSESQDKLKLVDRSEIDALYERNEWLTGMLEEQRLTIEALMIGCREHGLEGSTAVLTYIARLEEQLKNSNGVLYAKI